MKSYKHWMTRRWGVSMRQHRDFLMIYFPRARGRQRQRHAVRAYREAARYNVESQKLAARKQIEAKQ